MVSSACISGARLIPVPSQLTHCTVRPKHPLRCVPSGQHFPAVSVQREQLKTFPPPLSWGMSAF